MYAYRMWWCKFAQDNSYLISFFQPIKYHFATQKESFMQLQMFWQLHWGNKACNAGKSHKNTKWLNRCRININISTSQQTFDHFSTVIYSIRGQVFMLMTFHLQKAVMLVSTQQKIRNRTIILDFKILT